MYSVQEVSLNNTGNYFLYLNTCTMHFLLKPTNAPLYITAVSLYVIYTPTCFYISVLHLCLAKLHKFLKFKMLKIKFQKIVRIKYIKILFYRRLLIQ